MKKEKLEVMNIDGTDVPRGQSAQINISVARIPSGTKVYLSAHVFRSKVPGPTLLLLAGIHGDEINGIEILRRSIEEGVYLNLSKGTVIVIPLLNVFGFIHFSREVPDGKDVNRSFPGTSGGSLASRVASAITKKILPHVDYAIDFHTGGSSRYNYPQIRYSQKHEGCFDLARAFGAPFLIQKNVISRSFRKIASEGGAKVLVYEAGEAIRLDGYSIEVGFQGILNVMSFLGMLNKKIKLPQKQLKFAVTGWIRASDAGLFIWSKSSGQSIRKGESIGMIKSPQGERSKQVIAKRDGYIIGHNNSPVVQNGDALFHIAFDPEILKE